jgi:transposase
LLSGLGVACDIIAPSLTPVRIAKQLLRYGRIYREGKGHWTHRHAIWLRAQQLENPLAQAALEHLRCQLQALDAQIAAIDGQLDEIARTAPWREAVLALTCFRGVSTLTALGLLAEIGDFHRFANAPGRTRDRLRPNCWPVPGRRRSVCTTVTAI